MSRRRQDWTAEFDVVARDVAKLSGDDFVIDGEACALDDSGTPSFQLLQNRSARAMRLAYFAFDLLFEHGEDLAHFRSKSDASDSRS